MLAEQKSNHTDRSHKPCENPLGKRSAGNLHAAFDEAEAGNVTTIETEITIAEFAIKLCHTIESARQLSTLLTKHTLLNKDRLPPELNDQHLKKALSTLEVMNFSKEEREAYDDHLKWLMIEANTLKKRYEQGKEEGEQKKAFEIARNLLEAGVSPDLIIKTTGLSEAELNALKPKNR